MSELDTTVRVSAIEEMLSLPVRDREMMMEGKWENEPSPLDKFSPVSYARLWYGVDPLAILDEDEELYLVTKYIYTDLDPFRSMSLRVHYNEVRSAIWAAWNRKELSTDDVVILLEAWGAEMATIQVVHEVQPVLVRHPQWYRSQFRTSAYCMPSRRRL